MSYIFRKMTPRWYSLVRKRKFPDAASTCATNFNLYFIVSSGSTADIRVKDTYVSQRHTLISHKNRQFVENLSSSNGTFINGLRIERKARLGCTLVTLPGPLSDATLFMLPLPPHLTKPDLSDPTFEGDLNERNTKSAVENNNVSLNVTRETL